MGVLFCLPDSHIAGSFISLGLWPSPPSFLPAAFSPTVSFLTQPEEQPGERVLFWRSAARGFCDSSRLLRGSPCLFQNPQLGCRRWREQEEGASRVLPMLTLSRAALGKMHFPSRRNLGISIHHMHDEASLYFLAAFDRSHCSDLLFYHVADGGAT